jgi:formylglycine-generating enzyme required for sulfatase activity
VRPDARDPDVRWAYIPVGTFQMGCVPGDTGCFDSENPRHSVTLTRGFELMTTEVTLAIWRRTNRALPEQPNWNAEARQPVGNVNWDDASGVCSAMGGRLPTEAEWEYAARGGIEGALYPWGSDAPVHTAGASRGAEFAQGTPNSLAIGPGHPITVGRFGPNGFGLFDMAGNVWEWVGDWFGPYAPGAQTDPQGPSSGQRRVVRSASWRNPERNIRVSNRASNPVDMRVESAGVRCARDR